MGFHLCRSLLSEPVQVAICVNPACMNKPQSELLKLKKNVKIHTIHPGSFFAFDDEAINGPAIYEVVDSLGLTHEHQE